ncbi:hypothetical protein FK220_002505 [Flavobacteriaceae bacterium TP-CH-4]|uniref:Glycerophosphoryl diester phosphodiesterase membrane domain-containing protein n=1 Tax=Pelagihabitans pacificus TaxID=2696054 RepID=A0A967AX38_9FLAO|nr:hypothetical protein [Pelagihabitans pacificus]NHF58196.1 hypothetical protein [Pelagihabitans pacificus]
METTKERKPEASIIGSYRFGWQQLWKHFLYFFLILLIVALAESPASMAQKSELENGGVSFVWQMLSAAYALLLLPVITYGGNLLYLRGIRDEEIDFSELFVGFREKYLPIVLANLIKFALVGIGLVFLIIPGVILLCRLVFVSLLVMDKDMEPIPAIEKSWEMTKGHGWKIFGMGLLAIPVFIIGLVCFVVGAVVSVMWIYAAFTALYHAIDLKDQQRLLEDGF